MLTLHRFPISPLARKWLILFVLALPISTGKIFAADNEKTYGDLTIYYSVFNSDFLSPEVARQYDLTRSANLALVNISIRNTVENKSVTAEVNGNAFNLVGQNKLLAFKEIKEPDAVYYLASFRFSDNENFNFQINVKPDGGDASYPVQFKQTLYISK